MNPDFKPSEVRMWRAALPLIDTFGHAETEFAAALMVITCKQLGDEWQPVTPRQLGEAMKKAAEEGGDLHHLRAALLVHPDLRRLASDGFACFAGDPDAVPAPPIQFTDNGYEMLRKTVRAKPKDAAGP